MNIPRGGCLIHIHTHTYIHDVVVWNMNMFIKILINKLLVSWGIRLNAYMQLFLWKITRWWINTNTRINFHGFTTVHLPLPCNFLFDKYAVLTLKVSQGDGTEDLLFAFLTRLAPLSLIGLSFFLKRGERISHEWDETGIRWR